MINARVAKGVMGWRTVLYEGKWYREVWAKGWQCFTKQGIPRFSTDISAAMEVVEKMNERDYCFKLDQDIESAWTVEVWIVADDPDGMKLVAKQQDIFTITELCAGISKAALEAVSQSPKP